MRRAVRYLVGAIAGLCDLFGNLKLRDRVIEAVVYDGDTMDGFDLTSDLYRFHPKRWWRK
jgi:hypothetical protein